MHWCIISYSAYKNRNSIVNLVLGHISCDTHYKHEINTNEYSFSEAKLSHNPYSIYLCIYYPFIHFWCWRSNPVPCTCFHWTTRLTPYLKTLVMCSAGNQIMFLNT
jgi:hypothetical protein